VGKDDRDREELERDEPTVLPEREAISILAQTSRADDRDEQDEGADSS
jgi:hypothetical protein